MKNQNSLHIPLAEKLKSIPEVFGIRLNEEPEYDILHEDGDFEVRRYSKQLVAHVTVWNVNFDEFREFAFNKLASYIFSGNTQEKDVPMTAPVLQVQDAPNQWTMTFVLPAEYNLNNVPQPKDAAVKIEEVPGYDAAVHRYTGTNSLESMKAHEKKLTEWLNRQQQFKPEGKLFAGQYDGPFVIPFLRRNEIFIKVVSSQ